MQLEFRVFRICECTSSIPLLPPVSISKIGTLSHKWRKNSSSVRNGESRLVRSCYKPSTSSSSRNQDVFEELKFKGELDVDSKPVELKEEKRREVGFEEKEDEIEMGLDLENVRLRRGRQNVKRANILAKQVISIQSAVSLGFVSQLWVDTASWVVLVVEVKPNLFSGEAERFLLEDVSQVGDVVLVEDESVMENDFKMVGLDSLVGYRVATPGRRNIGKVRGYTFNMISGAVESLELDSFGISIIPSSLVSTYALLVEDVLEVISDMVVVHEAAALRIQRLTKGLWDNQNARTSIDELEEYSDAERPDKFDTGRSKRSFGRKKFHPRTRETEDEWELPMDYL
ncbi:hypothetical protein Dsin_017499 [Dipteronia sinensis]|uniref:PRC-barrel domain-containing protein n=1 Tax=Dipteronia sinensis TaxID=43782 RepID=A0AAE0AFT6_9ROSI|nr:hypothetical protein Dsin_017499 [Dipteronia sinensis]